MPFDPETIQSLLSAEAEYVEDLRERYGTAPIFERVNDIQRELQEKRFDEGSLPEMFGETQELLRGFDAQAINQGLMGQIVSLEGEGVTIPKLEVSPSKLITLLSVNEKVELSAETIEKYFAAQEVRGLFSGFTIVPRKNKDESYTPELAYQVMVDAIETPHATMNLYATGVAGKTELSFFEDRRRDEVFLMLAALYELCDEKQQTSLGLISRALITSDKLDASLMRHIGYHSNKIIKQAQNPETAQQTEDGLIDYIGRYVEIGQQVTIETNEYTATAKGDRIKFEYYDSINNTRVHDMQGQCAGFMFMKRAIIKDGEVIAYRKDRSLHVVFTHKERNIYVPLSELHSWV